MSTCYTVNTEVSNSAGSVSYTGIKPNSFKHDKRKQYIILNKTLTFNKKRLTLLSLFTQIYSQYHKGLIH